MASSQPDPPPSPGAIRALIALFASAFTSQGLGPGLRVGWDTLAIACLCIGVVLCMLSVFWNRLSGRIINTRLANNAVELGTDARWWAASVMILFLYVVFSPLLMNLANVGDLALHVYPTFARGTNRIVWTFEDQDHPPFFLGIEKSNLGNDMLVGFQAHGKNNSDKPISHVSGYVKSLITNREVPINIIADGQPTKPDDTNGIPPFAEFDVMTYGPRFLNIVTGVIQAKEKGESFSEFSEFEFYFEYDGNKFVRRFTKQEIQHQREMFDNITNPDKSSIPHVTRKVSSPTEPNAVSTPSTPAIPGAQAPH